MTDPTDDGLRPYLPMPSGCHETLHRSQTSPHIMPMFIRENSEVKPVLVGAVRPEAEAWSSRGLPGSDSN